MHFASLLFKLLESEGRYSGDITASIFSALGGVRLAYTHHLEKLKNDTIKVQCEHQLVSFLHVARTSPQPKKRIAVLHWAKSLFGFRHHLTIESMIVLAGDDDEAIRSEALDEFRVLRVCLRRAGSWKDWRDMTSSLDNILSWLLKIEDIHPSVSDATNSLQQQRINSLREEVFATASCTLEVFFRHVREYFRSNTPLASRPSVEFLLPDDWLTLPAFIAEFLSTIDSNNAAANSSDFLVSLSSVSSMMKILAVSSDPTVASISLASLSPAASRPTSPNSRHWRTSSSFLPDRLESIQAPLLIEKVRLIRHCVAIATGYTIYDVGLRGRCDIHSNEKQMDVDGFPPQAFAVCSYGRMILTPLLLHWLGSASDGEMVVIDVIDNSENEHDSDEKDFSMPHISADKVCDADSAHEGSLRRSSQAYIAQALGYLCIHNTAPLHQEQNESCEIVSSSQYVSQLWRILLHKLDSDCARAGRGALRCMTSIVEVLATENTNQDSDIHNIEGKSTLPHLSDLLQQRLELAVNYAADLVSLLSSLLMRDSTMAVENNEKVQNAHHVVIHPAEEHTQMLRAVALSSVAHLASRRLFIVEKGPLMSRIVQTSPLQEYCSSSTALLIRQNVEFSSEFSGNFIEFIVKAMLLLIPPTFNLDPSVLLKESTECGGIDSVREECRDNDKKKIPKKLDTFLRCMLLKALTELAAAAVHELPFLFDKCLKKLLSTSQFNLEGGSATAVRFTLAEGLIKMALTSHIEGGEEDFIPSRMMTLLEHIEQRVTAPAAGEVASIMEHERSFCGILLLVWLQRLRDWASASQNLSDDLEERHGEVFPSNALTRCCVIFLLLIRGGQIPKFSNSVNESRNETSSSSNNYDSAQSSQRRVAVSRELVKPEPFLQDACCAGLCIAYDISTTCSDTNGSNSDADNKVSDKIASLVISTLCREKKSIQPAGVATAGENTVTVQQNDTGTTLQQNLERLERTIPIPTGGEGRHEESGGDILAAAAARAQEALNIYHATVDDNDGATGRNIEQGQEDNYSYGVYTKICKVARKAG